MATLQPSLPNVRRVPKSFTTTVTSLLLLLAMILAGRWLDPATAWLLILALMGTMFLFLGSWICGQPFGILVSERNLMSLGRFQTVLWTWLLLSAYFAVVLLRIGVGLDKIPDPLAVGVDKNLWALLGISTASLVGSPLLLEAKRRKETPESAVDTAAKVLKEDAPEIKANSQGTLYSNPKPEDAALTDMFQGEEIGNTAYVDIAKLQMFFFTVIVAFSYGYALWHMFAQQKATEISQLPSPSPGMLGLLGISHAGYLGGKTVDYTPPKQ